MKYLIADAKSKSMINTFFSIQFKSAVITKFNQEDVVLFKWVSDRMHVRSFLNRVFNNFDTIVSSVKSEHDVNIPPSVEAGKSYSQWQSISGIGNLVLVRSEVNNHCDIIPFRGRWSITCTVLVYIFVTLTACIKNSSWSVPNIALRNKDVLISFANTKVETVSIFQIEGHLSYSIWSNGIGRDDRCWLILALLPEWVSSWAGYIPSVDITDRKIVQFFWQILLSWGQKNSSQQEEKSFCHCLPDSSY